MGSSTLKASISGIRGIVGSSLTPQVLIDYVSAFSQALPEGPVLLGRDSRPTGNTIGQLVISTLQLCGREVVDIGIIPTPVVLFGTAHGPYAGGIIITASHNPLEWNALKLVNHKGKFISPQEFKQLSEAYDNKAFSYVSHDKVASGSKNEAIPAEHLDKIVSFVDKEKIREKNFKVALDTVNGAGGSHTKKLLDMLGCQVSGINLEESGLFAHEPEPKPANLGQLSELCKKEAVDIGFALDPDGDRLVIAAADGTILSEEFTLALCLEHFLAQYGKSDVVINTSTSRIIEDIADKLGVKVHRVPTGEIHVTEKLEEIGAKIGGEGNGGIIIPELNKCRDASVGIALILDYLAQSGKSLAELAGSIPEYAFIKTKIPAEALDFDKLESSLKSKFKDAQFDTRDGIRISFEKKWALIRKSNTEPIIRISAEAATEKEAEELIKEVQG